MLPEVQRLRNIKHLGLTYLIYPCAKYNRLEHTLGTLFLAKRFLKYVSPNYSEKEVYRIHAAILLHDIGQGPFSQVYTDVLGRYGNQTIKKRNVHKIKTEPLYERLREIIKSEQKWVSNEAEADKEIDQICSILEASNFKNACWGIIYGPLGLDRLEYYQRDARYTGVFTGKVDVADIYREATIIPSDGQYKLCYGLDSIASIENVIVTRTHLYWRVYSHPQNRIAQTMLVRAVESHAKKDPANLQVLADKTDGQLLYALKHSDDAVAKEMANFISQNRLYTQAKLLRLGDYDKATQEQVQEGGEKFDEKAKELEEEVNIRLATKFGKVILDLDFPKVKPDLEKIFILKDGTPTPFSVVSPYSDAAEKAELRAWILGIYHSPDLKSDNVLATVRTVLKEGGINLPL